MAKGSGCEKKREAYVNQSEIKEDRKEEEGEQKQVLAGERAECVRDIELPAVLQYKAKDYFELETRTTAQVEAVQCSYCP